MMLREKFNLVNTPKEFQYDQAIANDPTLHFHGPFLRERDDTQHIKAFPFEKVTRPKTVYISLGTATKDQDQLLNKFVKAFDDPYFKDFNIVMVCSDPSTLGQYLPDNFITVKFAPQLEILKRSSLYICHGGVNSVMEAICYGVAQIILPQTAERIVNAKSVKSLRLGDYIDAYCSAAELREISKKVIADQYIQERLHKCSKIVKEQSKEKLVKEIYHYIQQGN